MFLSEALKLTTLEDWPSRKPRRKIPSKMKKSTIWCDVVGQLDDRQFNLFQAENKKCQPTSRQNFERVLNEGPDKFIDEWRKVRQKAHLTPSDPY